MSQSGLLLRPKEFKIPTCWRLLSVIVREIGINQKSECILDFAFHKGAHLLTPIGIVYGSHYAPRGLCALLQRFIGWLLTGGCHFHARGLMPSSSRCLDDSAKIAGGGVAVAMEHPVQRLFTQAVCRDSSLNLISGEPDREGWKDPQPFRPPATAHGFGQAPARISFAFDPRNEVSCISCQSHFMPGRLQRGQCSTSRSMVRAFCKHRRRS